MKLNVLVIFLFIFLLIVPPVVYFGFFISERLQDEIPDVFVGVDVAYADLPSIKNLVDETSSYTNTFVIGSTGITNNLTMLDEICQYLYDKGMYFMIYWEMPPETDFESYKKRWGDSFLGFYVHDEIGGRQLDHYEYRFVNEADNYTDAASQFIGGVNSLLKDHYGKSPNFDLFMSDYALYWFDYKAGFDTIFAEFVWNYSRQLNVALNRGAATVQNKDWGVMITWKYNRPPYIESGAELYDDMVYAYESGAKYILVFDTDANYTQSTLQREHLDALKRFWQYVKDNPRSRNHFTDRVAYVLPKDYGYGFRGPNDQIWGLWETTDYNYSSKINTEVSGLLNTYQNRLDIIYDDGLKGNNSYGYSELIFWNGTIKYP